MNRASVFSPVIQNKDTEKSNLRERKLRKQIRNSFRFSGTKLEEAAGRHRPFLRIGELLSLWDSDTQRLI